MAANNMQVNTGDISTAINTIKTQAGNFKDAYGEVIKQFNNIDNAWDGDDNVEFQNHFNTFKTDFSDMDDFFVKLTDFLQQAINEYQRVEREQKQKASSLKQ